MSRPFATTVNYDLLKVGHCTHRECVALRGGGRETIKFPALVGLIDHPQHGLMLYDTGYSQHFSDATRGFPESLYRIVTPVSLPPHEELLFQLDTRGIKPADIGTIFISHFHADHVAGLRDFPAARLIATGTERRICESKGRLGRLRSAYLRELIPTDFENRLSPAEDMPVIDLPDTCRPFTVAYDLLGDQSLLGVDLPGHAASQLGILFQDKDRGLIFLVADACWKIEGLAENRRPSRMAYGLFHQRTHYNETFERLRTLHDSPTPPHIIPSHCVTTWEKLGGTRRITRV